MGRFDFLGSPIAQIFGQLGLAGISQFRQGITNWRNLRQQQSAMRDIESLRRTTAEGYAGFGNQIAGAGNQALGYDAFPTYGGGGAAAYPAQAPARGPGSGMGPYVEGRPLWNIASFLEKNFPRLLPGPALKAIRGGQEAVTAGKAERAAAPTGPLTPEGTFGVGTPNVPVAEAAKTAEAGAESFPAQWKQLGTDLLEETKLFGEGAHRDVDDAYRKLEGKAKQDFASRGFMDPGATASLAMGFGSRRERAHREVNEMTEGLRRNIKMATGSASIESAMQIWNTVIGQMYGLGMTKIAADTELGVKKIALKAGITFQYNPMMEATASSILGDFGTAQQMKEAADRAGSGSWLGALGPAGSAAGLGIGALLALPTGGMSVPMGAALGGVIGGTAGGAAGAFGGDPGSAAYGGRMASTMPLAMMMAGPYGGGGQPYDPYLDPWNIPESAWRPY